MPRYNDDDEDEDLRPSRPDFQLEIGTRGVLGLFAALAIVCGLFFSFGYTIGKHSVPASFSLGDTSASATSAEPAATDKPAAGTPINTASNLGAQPPNPNDLTAAEVNQTPQTLVPAANGAAAVNASAPDATGNSLASTPPATAPVTAAPAPVSTPPPVRPAALTKPANNGSYAVQVFAGAKQGDALSLAAALKARQYPVFILRPVAGGDGLYRVQIGPYNTLPEAQQMRERLAADGYNAVIK